MLALLPPQARKALELLDSHNFEAYVIGGWVRDSLMGRECTDIDIATSALPQEICAVFEAYTVIPTGIMHGTVTVIIDSLPLEITTYRKDGGYSDFRHPEKVSFLRSLREDAGRRDFTVNALAYRPGEGITDYFGGTRDISLKVIRCIGNPQQRFSEDALRILRGLRFASVLGFEIEDGTFEAMLSCSSLLLRVSAERISSELSLLLIGSNCGKVLKSCPDIFMMLLQEVYPYHSDLFTSQQYDNFLLAARAVASLPPKLELRLAAFVFADYGKLFSGSSELKKTLCEAAAATAALAMRRLKFDGRTVKRVVKLINDLALHVPESEKEARFFLSRAGQLCSLEFALGAALACGAEARAGKLRNAVMLTQRVLERGDCTSLESLALSGRDITDMGLPPSAKVGEILHKLLEEVMSGHVPNTKPSLSRLASNLIKGIKNAGE